LKETKLIPDEYDPEFEDKIYNLLQDRLNKLYESLKVELFESKKSLSSDIIQDLQSKLEEKIIMGQMIAKSIGSVESKYSDIDTSYLWDRLQGMLKPILENLTLLYCRKYGLNLTPSYFQKASEESKEDEQKNSQLSDKAIFRNNDAILAAVDMLPKDLNKLIKELMDALNAKKPKEFVENLQKNANYYGLKVAIGEKKVEKNFFLAQKYFIKEALQGSKFDEKQAFFNLLTYLVAEQSLYFGLRCEDKAVGILGSVLLQQMGLSEEVKKDVQSAMSVYGGGSGAGELGQINKRLGSGLK